jgi:hypothetical protein
MRSLAAVALGAMLAGASAVAGAAARDWQAASGFFYDPVPRWTFNPERDLDFSDEVCPAIRKDCPQLQADEFQMSFAYDELYDVTGKLAGVRMIKGSGCRPLDEAIVLGQREFRAKFHKDGESDLDDIVIEVADGADPGRVRIVRRTDNLQFSGGCP